jgi:hypothetical protein
VPVLPYRELSAKNKLIKALLPAINHPLFKAAHRIPRRMLRRLTWALAGGPKTSLRFKSLRPNYQRPLCADSDAASSIDSHEAALYFKSRGYEILNPGASALKQLRSGSVPIVVRKR